MKTWMDDGFRTWNSTRFFLFRLDREDYQGDKCFRVTLHRFGRAFQYTKWKWSGY